MTALANLRSVWTPLPRQDVALRCPAFEVGFGGQKGGGKTDLLIAGPLKQIALAHSKYLATGMKQRGRAIIFRKNVKNLADIMARMMELYPIVDPEMGFDGWNKNERRWSFTSGYVVDVAHLDGPNDHLGYNGQEITYLGFDQVEEIEEEVVNFLIMQIRCKDDDMKAIACIRCTMNPGGKHAAWVKARFIEGCKPHNTIIREKVTLPDGREHVHTRAFIPSRLADNPYLDGDPSYRARMMKLPEHLRRMYLEGDWDVVVGAFFSAFLRKDVHYIKSFPIPATWQVKGSLDWGSTAPAAMLIGARDQDGNVYIIDELYTPGITGRTFGEKMQKKFSLQRWSTEKKWTSDDIYFLTDRQARANQGADGRFSNAAAGISSFGFRLFDANKDRLAGNEQVMERLLLRANGKPSLYVFSDRCPNLARTLPLLEGDPANPEDVNTDGEDHAFDALKFLLLDWPIQDEKPRTKEDAEVERWIELSRARKRAGAETTDSLSTGYE